MKNKSKFKKNYDWKGLVFKCVVCDKDIINPIGLQFICKDKDCRRQYHAYLTYKRDNKKLAKEIENEKIGL